MRKILIVPIGKVDEHLQMALDNGIAEIVEGVPLFLSGIYSEDNLPVIHTEEEINSPTLPTIEDRVSALESFANFSLGLGV